jgi:hypothetical protein
MANPTIYSYHTIDSLKKINSQLSIKLDSVQKSIEKINIKLENLDKITYLQISAFILIVTIIVAIAGFLSWGAVFASLRRRERRLRVDIANQLAVQKIEFDSSQKSFEIKFEEMSKNQEVIANRAMRGMYFHCVQHNQLPSAVAWVLRICCSYLKTEDYRGVTSWIDFAEIQLDKSSKINLIEDDWKELLENVSLLKSYNNDEFQKKLAIVEEKLYRKKYQDTKPIEGVAPRPVDDLPK